MASLRKHKNFPFWWACYSLPDGTRLQRSTKTKDKSLALQIALAAEKAARAKATVDQAREIMHDIVERVHGETAAKEEVASEFLDRWLARRRREVSVGTAARYERVIKHAKKFFDSQWISRCPSFAHLKFPNGATTLRKMSPSRPRTAT